MTEARPDAFDEPWKEAIEEFFEPFMALLFPGVHAGIDWPGGHRFLETELRAILPEAEASRRVADKLAEVQLRDGTAAWVLVHIEVQAQPDPALPLRLFTCAYRIFERYDRPVASLAVLADPRPGWRPRGFEMDVLGSRLRLDFLSVKLVDFDRGLLEESANPFATVVLAHLSTLETAGKPEERLLSKLRLVKLLLRKGWERDRVRRLFHFLEWLMRLPEGLKQRFRDEMRQEEGAMSFINTFEEVGFEKGVEKGIQKGIQQGRQVGEQDAILDVLRARFGRVPATLQGRVRAVTDQQHLRALVRAAATATSLKEFRTTAGRLGAR